MKTKRLIQSLSMTALILISTPLTAAPDTLAPGSIVDDDQNFVIKREDWWKIQRYVSSSRALPTSEDELQTFLRLGKDDDFNLLGLMSTTFNATKEHAILWDSDIMPKTVQLAVDVSNYADKAKTFYGPLEAEIDKLIDDEDNPRLRRNVSELLLSLAKSANTYAARATEVENILNDFAGKLQQDSSELTRLDDTIKGQYGDESTLLSDLRNKIKDKNDLLEKLNRDYEMYVKIAATTPTYAIVIPFGTIAAGIVAGIFGDQAVKTLSAIHEVEDQISALGAREAQYARLRNSTELAQKSTDKIAEAVREAIAPIQAIQSHWTLMNGDLKEIARILQEDVSEAIPLLQQLSVSEAKDKWKVVGDDARRYVRTAYITIVPKT